MTITPTNIFAYGDSGQSLSRMTVQMSPPKVRSAGADHLRGGIEAFGRGWILFAERVHVLSPRRARARSQSS